jgi:AAHS family 3-hydroxyphenylpropionic acid transporter
MDIQPATRADGSARTVPPCLAVALLEGFDLQAAGVAAPKLAPAL